MGLFTGYKKEIKLYVGLIFFVLGISNSNAVDINLTKGQEGNNNISSCLQGVGRITRDSLSDCYAAKQRADLQTISTGRVNIPMLRESYTIELGLGDPIFSGLKRKRDNFIDKYISQPIAKVTEIRDKNIQKYNLKTLYSNMGGPTEPLENTLIRIMKNVFGLDDLSDTFAGIKEKRLEKCQKGSNDKKASCLNIGDSYEKAKCFAEAQDIVDNCYKFTTNVSGLDKVRNQLGKWEDKILEEIASVSLMKSDEIQKLKTSIRNSTKSLDDTMNDINDSLSLEIGGKLGDFLNETEPHEIIERKIGAMLGVDESIMGAGTFSGNNTGDLLNFKSIRSKKINNLCDLTSCLVYPKSKKFYPAGHPSEGDPMPEYKSKCLDQGLSTKKLNEKVNEARKKIILMASKMILKKLLIELPIQEYMNQLKRSLVCAQHATAATLKQSFKKSDALKVDDIKTTTEESDSIVDEALGSVAAHSKTAKRVAECTTFSNTQQQTKSTNLFKLALTKISNILKSTGLTTSVESIPFGALNAQGGVEGENLASAESAAKANLEDCLREGQEITWVSNYNKCNAEDMDFNLNFEFNFKIPQLMEAQRKQTKQQCEASLAPISRKFTFVFDSLNKNPSVTPSYSVDAERWADLKLKLNSSNNTLRRMKISPRSYYPTEQSLCSKKILRLIDNQEYSSKDFECKILDEPNAPLLKMAEVELEDYGKDGTLTNGELPTKLIPSVKRLCIESSKKVIDNFKNQPVFTPKEIKAIEDDQENIYNIKNAKRTEDKFKITRAISNINFCNNFFSNIGNYNLDKELDIKMVLNYYKNHL